MRRLILLGLLFFLFYPFCSRAQHDASDSASSIPMFYGFYGYQWPGADMAEQFGSNSVIGPGFMWKTGSNWLFGAEYNFMFGNNVKNGLDILKYLLNSEGDVISGDGTPSVVALFERANTVGVKAGKIFPVIRNDRNSGLFFTAGLGYMSHKVRIEVENNSAPQLKGDYKRGYDRLSGGLMLSQSVGFMYFGKSRLLNLTLSVEVLESWTKSYREYYFDLMAPPPEGRQFNFLIGPKIAWMLPLRQRNVNKVYYY